MEMSPDYLNKAALAFETNGFALTRSEAVLGELPEGPCRSTKYDLRRGDAEHFVLEWVAHPTEGDRYFLEIVGFHGLRSFSFPLDSWKVRPTSIELKYYTVAESGLGLSLTFALDHAGPRAA
jgi:hypothetical protein